MEMLLTVEQTAERLNLKPVTIQRQLKRGILRGIKRGRQWRVPESALLESQSIETIPDSAMEATKAILGGLHSTDSRTRNAAIVALAKADSLVQKMVEEMIAEELEHQDEVETDDFADWRAMDSEPFIDDNDTEERKAA